ncbi:MAG: ferrous iron transport protein A [Candidatus Melainabacteria bacterium]|nr:ferrous iron transport protein A [Candidatus Melainabacteria bacterium]
MTSSSMNLADAKDGQKLLVVEMANETVNKQALRFGIGRGSLITVQKNISKGPVIISRNQLEIAIGRELALQIKVSSKE